MEEADIIIIGAGTAGCVLANRLSADSSISVLVLEAGQDRSKDARVYTPARSRELLGDPDFDWAFESELEPGLAPFPSDELHVNIDSAAAAGKGLTTASTAVDTNGDGFGADTRHGRRMKQPRGKVVGGSSSINSFALIYPSAEEFDFWAHGLGNEGWDWKGVKQFFRKYQTLIPPEQQVIDKLSLSHNLSSGLGDGPIQATFPITVSPPQQAWLAAFRELGLENLQNPLEGHAVGGGVTANHIDGERRERSHAGVAYLDPVRGRLNLRTVTGALVTRVQFEKAADDRLAVAKVVVYEQDGKRREVRVRREVILAAGVFGSPQLLELSGIGDARLLARHGIDIVHDNPAVGENLQDHIRSGISYEAAEATDSKPLTTAEEAQRLYEETRLGPWAEMAAYMFAYMPLAPFSSAEEEQQLEKLCKEHLDSSKANNLSPFERKHQAFVQGTLFSPKEASATAFLTRRPAVPFPLPELEKGKPVTLCTMLSHPLSRGSVHITSPNPTIKPAIKFNYYAHSLDLEVHARHLLALQRLARTPALSALIKEGGAKFPAEDLTLETAKQYLKETATTNYHPCGTCAMQPRNMGGVVDPELKVYGTKNLRAVDASVFPVVPRGNIITTVYAVAEKGADLISRKVSR